MVIGIDFDGTCVTNDFPNIGHEIGATPVLKELVKKGHKLVLFTMRSNMITPKIELDTNIIRGDQGMYLNNAIQWFNMRNIPLYGIQKNPTQINWTESPKAYCDLYIDDAALGAPVILDVFLSDKPFLDWDRAKEMLINRNIL